MDRSGYSVDVVVETLELELSLEVTAETARATPAAKIAATPTVAVAAQKARLEERTPLGFAGNPLAPEDTPGCIPAWLRARRLGFTSSANAEVENANAIATIQTARFAVFISMLHFPMIKPENIQAKP
jgi:hypothetical protein